MPGLAARREDIALNLDYEFDRYAEREGERITFNKEARDLYLSFATEPDALWSGNFRDLAASLTRLAKLSPKGRITKDCVEDKIARLKRLWLTSPPADGKLQGLLPSEELAAIDPFDQAHSPLSYRSARKAGPFRKQAGNYSPPPARRKNPPTMPTGCANIWPAVASPGTKFKEARSLADRPAPYPA